MGLFPRVGASHSGPVSVFVGGCGLVEVLGWGSFPDIGATLLETRVGVCGIFPLRPAL